MSFVKFLATIALVISIFWFIVNPGFEPVLAVVGSISTLVSEFIIKKQNKQNARDIQQHQSVTNSSIGVQAGGDVNIANRGSDQHVK